jgi:hypothetical protein
VPYLKNEKVWWHGITWRAVAETSIEPHRLEADWRATSLINGRGDMSMNSATAGLPIGAVWIPITEWDATPLIPVGCSFNTTVGEFSFAYVGVWQLSFYCTFVHNEIPQSRLCGFRIYNVTDAFPGRPALVATGRNATATSYGVSFLVDIARANLGNQFIMEIGGGDDYSAVTYQTLELSLLQVGL